MRRYLEIYSIMLRNSLIREMSFKANFILWMIVEVLWFCGQIRFLQHHLRPGRSDRRLDEMGSRPARRHAPDHRATFPGVFLRQRRQHSGTGAHRKTRFASRPADRQPVRRFDQTIRARQRDQRARSARVVVIISLRQAARRARAAGRSCSIWSRSASASRSIIRSCSAWPRSVSGSCGRRDWFTATSISSTSRVIPT